MSLSPLPLSYCTNVHPGRSLAEVEAGLDRYTVPVKQAYGQPLAAGLWLARPVVQELIHVRHAQEKFAKLLYERGLTCHTLNAFPFGNFHSERVKENVYLPDWSQPERLDYSQDCARVLASLLPAGVSEGSISTLPLGFKSLPHSPDFIERCIQQLLDLAESLDTLFDHTGKTIRFAIEPEPMCELETTSESIEFFRRLRSAASSRGAGTAACVREYLGICFDVCHQAVEYEDVAESIREIHREDIRINKVHLSCALQLDDPRNNADGRDALQRYVEPRYLHQTFASASLDGHRAKAVDLTNELIKSPGEEFLSAESWRIHFHVPVDADRIGPLATTRPALKQALAAVALLEYAPHLEVETYTWEVLPGEGKPDLVKGLTRELAATRQLLAEVAPADKMPARAQTSM